MRGREILGIYSVSRALAAVKVCSQSNKRWSLVPKIWVAPGMESLSLNLPSFPPRPQSHSLATTRQASPSSSVLDFSRWDRQATSLCGLRKPSCVNPPHPAHWLLGAISPACTNCSVLSPPFPSAGPWDLSTCCSDLSLTSCHLPGQRKEKWAGNR